MRLLLKTTTAPHKGLQGRVSVTDLPNLLCLHFIGFAPCLSSLGKPQGLRTSCSTASPEIHMSHPLMAVFSQVPPPGYPF